MTSKVNLKDLVNPRELMPLAAPPRRIASRYVLPTLVLGGFIMMLIWASWDHLLPAREVTVVPVITSRAEVKNSGAPLFQAPGWIEPRPRPVVVSALIEGVIQDLLIVEGQAVKKGETIARLIDVDARLAFEQAENEYRQRQAQCELTKAELAAARSRLENPVHLDALLAEAESALARTSTERAKLPSLIESASIRLRFAEQDLSGKQQSQDAISERLLQRSQSERDAASTELTELQGRDAFLDREIVALENKRKALASQRQLLVEEKLRLADAEARVRQADGNLRQAELSVQGAQLRLDRTHVVSPISGRVLQVIVRPGTRVMGLSPNSAQDSTTVATLYDPAMLQVRADVRLEDVPNVQPGQKVQIETASASHPLDGEVLFATSSANIQKNTLEVKVAIHNPPQTIRPEMLTKVTFLSPETTESASPEPSTERILVPRSLIEKDGVNTFLWVVEGEGHAIRRSIQLGQAGTEELAEAVSGIQPTDRLISSDRQNLNDGDRVTIVREDASLGLGIH
ncbi:efflux RND transporter periplasmic adaptor subunit [bacterium]|nr:efflux RND transporter periplasmic adaptor subunit [bacterium]